MKRISFVLMLASIAMLFSAPCYGVSEITLDQVDGLFGSDTVLIGAPVRFTFRMTYDIGIGSNLSSFANGFRVWTHRNGAYTDNFNTIIFDTLSVYPS